MPRRPLNFLQHFYHSRDILFFMNDILEACPKCTKPLNPVTTTATGRQLQRCSAGSWNPQTKQNEGCDYVKWLQVPAQELDEKCPKCSSPLVLQTTRFGKKMKKCSTGGWDKESDRLRLC